MLEGEGEKKWWKKSTSCATVTNRACKCKGGRRLSIHNFNCNEQLYNVNGINCSALESEERQILAQEGPERYDEIRGRLHAELLQELWDELGTVDILCGQLLQQLAHGWRLR